MYCSSSVFVLIISVFVGLSLGSSIPVWEFLKREEKEINIYSIFAKDVDSYCKSAPTPNCNREILKYGLDSLKKMNEDELDLLDPYQHGADNKIWTTLLNGHRLAYTTVKPSQTTTAKPNSYDDESFGENFQFGDSGSASAKIDNIYRVPPPKGFVYLPPQNTYPYPYVNQRDNVKTAPNNNEWKVYAGYPTTTSSPAYFENGRFVVKVYPDGKPVRQYEFLPQDDDLSQYRYIRRNIPHF